MSRSIAVLVALALAAGCSPEPPVPTPAPTPSPEITAETTDLRTLPDAGDGPKQVASAELSALLTDLYGRGLLPPLPAPSRPKVEKGATQPPAPTPVPRPPVDELFTEPARAALGAGIEAFRSGADLRVQAGVVRFGGVATLEGETPTRALLTVDLAAEGRLTDRRAARLKHTGQLYCVRTDAGWRVAGYDVNLVVEREAAPAVTTRASFTS